MCYSFLKRDATNACADGEILQRQRLSYLALSRLNDLSYH